MPDIEETSRRVASVFGRAAPTYDSVIPFFAHFGLRLVEVAQPQPGEWVLDVGAGRGASAFPAAVRVRDDGFVVAVDRSPEMVGLMDLEKGRRRVTNLATAVLDAHRLGFSEAFDVVLAGSVLHLVADPMAAAEAIHQALRPHGRCVVSHPTGGGEAWSFFGKVIDSYKDRAARPLQRPPASSPDLAATLEAVGFVDIAVTEEVGEFLFPDEDAWWRWVWSTGMRASLEAFDDDVLSEVRAEMLLRVARLAGPDGIPLRQTARFLAARR